MREIAASVQFARSYRERKRADTIGTVLVPRAGHLHTHPWTWQ